jgi:hypothetical protein
VSSPRGREAASPPPGSKRRATDDGRQAIGADSTPPIQLIEWAVRVGTAASRADGIILMIAGALGLVLSLLFWSSFSPYRRSRTVPGPDTAVEERRIEPDLP